MKILKTIRSLLFFSMTFVSIHSWATVYKTCPKASDIIAARNVQAIIYGPDQLLIFNGSQETSVQNFTPAPLNLSQAVLYKFYEPRSYGPITSVTASILDTDPTFDIGHCHYFNNGTGVGLLLIKLPKQCTAVNTGTQIGFSCP